MGERESKSKLLQAQSVSCEDIAQCACFVGKYLDEFHIARLEEALTVFRQENACSECNTR